VTGGLTVVSLFSGCGGFDLGVRRAGHKVIWANDNRRAAAETYKANFPKVNFVFGDIRKITEFPSADLVVGCYPCQGYSEGGRREEDHDENYLYRQFARCLRTVRPKAFIAENVAGMTKLFGGGFLRRQIRVYRSLGYHVAWRLLNAASFGVPQERKRVFLVGIRPGTRLSYQFPSACFGPGLKPYKTLSDVIHKMPRWPRGEYWNEPFHWYYLSRNRRRGWDQVSLCICANRRHVPLHPMSKPLTRRGPDKWTLAKDSRYRRLSFRECAAIQTFPPNFIIPDTLSIAEKYWVIGNAVPPVLAARVVGGLRIGRHES
jgi:DNA (cytosine-5)-methyltransferase 1